MKQHPIIFNTEMVRAILDGRKTQTRRPFPKWQQPFQHNDESFGVVAQRHPRYGFGFDGASEDEVMAQFTAGLCPIANLGDQLWVREALTLEKWPDIHYVCGGLTAGTGDEEFNYRGGNYRGLVPSIHAPKWSSRIILEVTDVRVQKVYDAPNDDYKAEGYPMHRENSGGDMDPFLWFRGLWGSIYDDKNQWVWVIEFKVIRTEQVGAA